MHSELVRSLHSERTTLAESNPARAEEGASRSGVLTP
jgi:hypothetical protein